MANREQFAPDEWYHCYTKGVEGRKVFQNKGDYERFLQLLYLTNNTEQVNRSNLLKATTADILRLPRKETIVSIGAYCLMPNHFHVLLKEKTSNGISQFMRRLGIAYAMYFNIKYERIGNLFVKPFRSKHVLEDRYFKRVIQYIHLNAAELFEPNWKIGNIKNARRLENELRKYRYSSLADYNGANRTEGMILDSEVYDWIKDELPDIGKLIPETIEYYQELAR